MPLTFLKKKHRAAHTFLSSKNTLVVVSRSPKSRQVDFARRTSNETRTDGPDDVAEQPFSTIENELNGVSKHTVTVSEFQTTLRRGANIVFDRRTSSETRNQCSPGGLPQDKSAHFKMCQAGWQATSGPFRSSKRH